MIRLICRLNNGMLKWRNWKTRSTQNAVSRKEVRVRFPFSAQQKTVIRLMACPVGFRKYYGFGPDEVIQNGRHRVFEVSNVNFHRRRDNNQIQMKSTMTFLQ